MGDKDLINDDGEEIKQEDESELPLSLSKKIIKFTFNKLFFSGFVAEIILCLDFKFSLIHNTFLLNRIK